MDCSVALLRDVGLPPSIEQIELDGPGPTELLVRVAAVGLCGTDYHGMWGSTRRNEVDDASAVPAPALPPAINEAASRPRYRPRADSVSARFWRASFGSRICVSPVMSATLFFLCYGVRPYATRTVVRNVSVSVFKRAEFRESSCAAARTLAEDALVSVVSRSISRTHELT